MNGVNVDRVIGRFKALMEVQKELSLEVIDAKYTEHDLKEIIYLLGELKTIKPVIEELEDLKDFASDIIYLRDNYNNISPYYCEDLEFDFFTFMEKWNKKIEHYKWEGDRND